MGDGKFNRPFFLHRTVCPKRRAVNRPATCGNRCSSSGIIGRTSTKRVRVDHLGLTRRHALPRVQALNGVMPWGLRIARITSHALYVALESSDKTGQAAYRALKCLGRTPEYCKALRSAGPADSVWRSRFGSKDGPQQCLDQRSERARGRWRLGGSVRTENAARAGAIVDDD